MGGFSINVGSFVNSSFNERLAEEIFCATGFHYLIDTSRNGGPFSDLSLDEINMCTYDPPNVQNGTIPQWRDGSKFKEINVKSSGEMPGWNRWAPQLLLTTNPTTEGGSGGRLTRAPTRSAQDQCLSPTIQLLVAELETRR